VWRSVCADGDTKTENSCRTLQLPTRCVAVLKRHRAKQSELRDRAGERWQDYDLVFSTRVGTELDAANVRRSFRNVVRKAGLKPKSGRPRELRPVLTRGAEAMDIVFKPKPKTDPVDQQLDRQRANTDYSHSEVDPGRPLTWGFVGGRYKN